MSNLPEKQAADRGNEFVDAMLGRGIPSTLAGRIAKSFPDWESMDSGMGAIALETGFTAEERDFIRRAKSRREIPKATVRQLVEECGFRCCLCWNIDADTGIVIHHIKEHAAAPDDTFENLVVLCPDHHSRVHTKWELARHPFPPELVRSRKTDFVGALAAFRAGTRAAPGREQVSPAPPMPAPPGPALQFTGREAPLAAFCSLLAAGNRRAAIVGMGGVGKTALLLKALSAFTPTYPGGILWFEPHGEGPLIQSLLRHLISSLGGTVQAAGMDEQFASARGLLAHRITDCGDLLLALDDLPAKGLDGVVKLLAGLPPGLAVALTTRELPVAAALDAKPLDLAPLDRSESLRLLQGISASPLATSKDPAVDGILGSLGDLPLAVELVARQIALREKKPGFSLKEMSAQLAAFNPGLLSFPGHRGIAASFALSYDALDTSQQSLFRSLGILAEGPMQRSAVSEVAALDMSATETVMDHLVMCSMLHWDRSPGAYRIHPLLHRYSVFLLERAPDAERSAVATRFRKHFIEKVHGVIQARKDDLGAVDAIYPNAVKAIRAAAAAADHRTVSDTMFGLWGVMEYFQRRSLELEAMPLLELAVRAARELRDREQTAVHIANLGAARARTGNNRQAIADFERAVELTRKGGNEHDLASHLQNLGLTLHAEGRDPIRAERVLREAYVAAERSKNLDALMGTMNTLGGLYRQDGRLKEAERCYASALAAARIAKHRLSEGNNLSNLGLVRDNLGHTEDAEKMITEALAIAREIGDRRGEGNRIGHLGGIMLRKAMALPNSPARAELVDRAREHITEALRLAELIHDMEKCATWTLNLGHILKFSGNYAQAAILTRKAIAIAQECGFAHAEGQATYNLGALLAEQGAYREALDCFQAAKKILVQIHSPMATSAEHNVRRLVAILSSKSRL